MPPRPIFVASLGNPHPYINTFHSAGHTLITALAVELSYPFFRRSPLLGNALVSAGPDFTLWQSPSLMNESGKLLRRAWRTFLASLTSKEERGAARLVVIHDELQTPLGNIKAKTGGSVKGHLGLKSCVSELGEKGFVRIGVGIGRPESREPEDVRRFVLRKMTAAQAASLCNGAGSAVAILNRIREEGEG